jgi:hypothetical protein
MPRCPNCRHDVRLPYFTYLSGLRWQLTCQHCKAALETKRPRSAPVIASLALVFPLLIIEPDVVFFRLAAVILMVAVAVFTLFESLRPRLRLRNKLPEPDVFLEI